MPTEDDYRKNIQHATRDDLLQLWSKIQQRDTPGWEPGKAFEYLVLRAFELDGARIRWPFSVFLEDQEVEQIDGAVYAAGLSCLV
jgi:hypothetical protein